MTGGFAKMRRIDLDYSPRRRRAGWAVLAAGIAAAATVAVLHRGLADRTEQWERAAQRLAHRPDALAAARADPASRQELARQVENANEVIGRLSLPWNALFRGIEASATDTVALLSVQPMPQQKLVALNGEARSYADVLRYMERLDASGALERARLLSHKVKREDPRHPVAFAIAAGWRMAP